MKVIGLASDHAGFELKQYVKQWLEAKGWEYKDFGTYSTDSCDYPDFAHPLALAVEAGECFINTEMADKIMSEFFTTDFEGGRHQARIDKIPVK